MTEAQTDSTDLHEYGLRARNWLALNLERNDGADLDLAADPSRARIAEVKQTQARLYKAGYAGFTFPKRYGGQGLTVDHERVFLEEAAEYDVPSRHFGVSINILGVTLSEYGTEEQKIDHIPRILSGQETWLQLLSEPNGGSDLAGLLTSATRDGDHFIVNGQKIWSSGAHYADFALCPVRTRWDVPKYRGISVLIVDLRSPGIEIRRIKQITGESHFCEEFFTDVAVPAPNLVGEENEGWRVLRGLLAIEHAWTGRGAKRVDLRRDVADLVELVKRQHLESDVGVSRRIVQLHVAMEAHKLVSARVTDGIAVGKLSPEYGSLLKLGSDVIAQCRAQTGLALAGLTGVMWEASEPAGDEWAHTYLTSRSISIGGGTDEILRNNVSEKVLGLPREPAVDREVPFNQVLHN